MMPNISVTSFATKVSTNASEGVILWTPWTTVRRALDAVWLIKIS
jgi:hypothetical protein